MLLSNQDLASYPTTLSGWLFRSDASNNKQAVNRSLDFLELLTGYPDYDNIRCVKENRLYVQVNRWQ